MIFGIFSISIILLYSNLFDYILVYFHFGHIYLFKILNIFVIPLFWLSLYILTLDPPHLWLRFLDLSRLLINICDFSKLFNHPIPVQCISFISHYFGHYRDDLLLLLFYFLFLFLLFFLDLVCIILLTGCSLVLLT